jgi:hypothetical protein
MKALQKNKFTILAIVIFFVVIFFYNSFIKENQVIVEEGSEAAQAIGADLLALSDELRQVNLGTELFTTKLYLALTDFSNPIPPQPIGRANPFDLLGR